MVLLDGSEGAVCNFLGGGSFVSPTKLVSWQNNVFVKPFVSGSCRIGAIITSSASFSL